MATYEGSAGIAQLKAKIARKSKLLVGESVAKITTLLVDNSPLGVEYYPSKQGEIANDVGDYKNNWQVGIGMPDQTIRSADPSGAGAVAGAITAALRYNLEDKVYITNSVEHAGMVEEGWRDNPEYGWKAKDGYHVVALNRGAAEAVLSLVAARVSKM